VISLLASVHFLAGSESEPIIFALGIAQASATVFLLILILLFSQRDASIDNFIRRSDEFLTLHVHRAFERISIPSLNIEKFSVIDTGKKDLFGRLFLFASERVNFRVWVGLNVHRVFVIYFIRTDGHENFVERAQAIFQFTFGGATTVGFAPYYEVANVDGESILSIWLTARTAADLLTNPYDKLFWSQDVTMMTESFIRTAIRNGLDVNTTASPGPL